MTYGWWELDSVKRRFPPIYGRYPAVAGGRWFIRRWESGVKDRKYWHAWSRGQAKKYNRRFKTHDEAVRWVDRVTMAYAMDDKQALLDLYYEKYPNVVHRKVVRNRQPVLF